MNFDPENKIVKLCAGGMALEGEGKTEDALKLFQQAWEEAANDFEKFTSAHYVARHQKNTSDKLKWDNMALEFALKINHDNIKGNLPSLYLNVGRCHEDLHDYENAVKNYKLALSFTDFLPADGYGKMIKNGIENAFSRLKLYNNYTEEENKKPHTDERKNDKG